VNTYTLTADCRICGAPADVTVEPPERSHGYRYPGHVSDPEPTCDCADLVRDLEPNDDGEYLGLPRLLQPDAEEWLATFDGDVAAYLDDLAERAR